MATRKQNPPIPPAPSAPSESVRSELDPNTDDSLGQDPGGEEQELGDDEGALIPEEVPHRQVMLPEDPSALSKVDAIAPDPEPAPPAQEMPSQAPPQTGPQALSIAEHRARAAGTFPNEAGVSYDPQTDRCANLNSSWRNGTCVVQGNAPCPYLGGNVNQCPLFKDLDAERERRASLPPHLRYR